MTINYAGTGNDVEDGILPASAFTWWVDLHHDEHTHPRMPPVSGSKTGSFTIPTSEETSSNVFYRFHLQVTDSGGLTQSVSRDILPRKSTITLATNPAGLQLRLDGQPVTAPHSFVGVEGIVRSLEAVSPQGHELGLLILVGRRYARAQHLDADGGYDVYGAVCRATCRLDCHRQRVDPRRRCRDQDRRLPGKPFERNATPVSVGWKTTNGSAKSVSDYTSATGTVTFPAGSTSRTIAVTIMATPPWRPRRYSMSTSRRHRVRPSPMRAAWARSRTTMAPARSSFSASSYQKTENGGSCDNHR